MFTIAMVTEYNTSSTRNGWMWTVVAVESVLILVMILVMQLMMQIVMQMVKSEV